MKKRDNSKTKLKSFVFIAVIILAIGYAIVTTSIILIQRSNKGSKNYIFPIGETKDDDSTGGSEGNSSNGKSKSGSNGKSNEKSNEDFNGSFDVHFITNDYSPKIIKGTGTASIDEDDDTVAYFDITDLAKKGDYASVQYYVLNDSNGFMAKLNLELTNTNPEYFKVDKKVDAELLDENQVTIVTVRIELINTPIDNPESTSVSLRVAATPLKK